MLVHEIFHLFGVSDHLLDVVHDQVESDRVDSFLLVLGLLLGFGVGFEELVRGVLAHRGLSLNKR